VASHRQRWVRAQRGGIVHIQVELGARVVKRQPLAAISDPMGERQHAIRSPGEGYVIGGITNPLVNRGDAVLHLAFVDPPAATTPAMPRQLDNHLDGASEALRLAADDDGGAFYDPGSGAPHDEEEG
jgi:hypothetical protein